MSAILAGLHLERRALSETALFAASRAFLAYRRHGGVKTNVLPDFFIGAQAETEGRPLLTRAEGRYRSYFPDIRLIAPDAA